MGGKERETRVAGITKQLTEKYKSFQDLLLEIPGVQTAVEDIINICSVGLKKVAFLLPTPLENAVREESAIEWFDSFFSDLFDMGDMKKLFQKDALWHYLPFTLIGAETIRSISSLLNIQSGEKVVNLSVLAAILVTFFWKAIDSVQRGHIDRGRSIQATLQQFRGYAAEMRSIITANADGKGVDEREIIRIKMLLSKFWKIIGSFEKPTAPEFLYLLGVPDSGYTPQSEAIAQGTNLRVIEILREEEDEITSLLRDMLTELKINVEGINKTNAKGKISEDDKIKLISAIRFLITDKMNLFCTAHVPPDKKNARTMEIESIHAILGRFITLIKEKLKPGEKGFFFLAFSAIIIVLISPQTSIPAFGGLFGYYLALITDASFGEKPSKAMAPTDDPLLTASSWAKAGALLTANRLVQRLEAKSSALPAEINPIDWNALFAELGGRN